MVSESQSSKRKLASSPTKSTFLRAVSGIPHSANAPFGMTSCTAVARCMSGTSSCPAGGPLPDYFLKVHKSLLRIAAGRRGGNTPIIHALGWYVNGRPLGNARQTCDKLRTSLRMLIYQGLNAYESKNLSQCRRLAVRGAVGGSQRSCRQHLTPRRIAITPRLCFASSVCAIMAATCACAPREIRKVE